MIGNDEYSPTLAANCNAATLQTVGDTDCPTLENLEVAEISELYLDAKSETLGSPLNPVTPYTAGTGNGAAFTTWRTGSVDNTETGKVRVYYGIGEKPETEESTVTLHRGKVAGLSTKHPFTFRINLIDPATYEALRYMQRNKGEYHLWFATDTYIYGGSKGMLVNIEKVTFPKDGSRGSNAYATIKIGWLAQADPIRDKRTW
jgi:hypothetical protein